MKIAVGASEDRDPVRAAREAFAQLCASLEEPPQVLLVHGSEHYPLEVLRDTLRELQPGVAVHGGTSSRGAITPAGRTLGAESGAGLAVWGAHDDSGAFGVAGQDLGESPVEAARNAVREALSNARRPGELPDLVWLTAAPGHEEEVLNGIEDVLGPNVPVVGGSSADDDVSGRWRQLANEKSFENGVVVTVMYLSVPLAVSFHSGYVPTEHSGVVTRAAGRTVLEIDGRPAADVYDGWTGGALEPLRPDGGSALALTTMTPLGRSNPEGDVGVLLHPEYVTADGALRLFANVNEGETLVMMRGDADALASRANRVVAAARASLAPSAKITGGLVIYCAGCMLAIEPRMGEVASGISDAMSGSPFIGVFSFGEQGARPGRGNEHGNLMISAVVFGDSVAL